MPNINDSFPSMYLKASDLRGAEVMVTIDHVEIESVGRQKETKPVVYFKGKEKGLVLNKTNAKKISDLAGSDLTEDWHGVRIKLYPTETEFAGETVDCIRVKPVAPTRGGRPIPVEAPESKPAIAAGAEDDDIPF